MSRIMPHCASLALPGPYSSALRILPWRYERKARALASETSRKPPADQAALAMRRRRTASLRPANSKATTVVSWGQSVATTSWRCSRLGDLNSSAQAESQW